MHEKILNFILLNNMHMVMIHLILLWEVAEKELLNIESFLLLLHHQFDVGWCFFGSCFVAFVSLSTQSSPSIEPSRSSCVHHMHNMYHTPMNISALASWPPIHFSSLHIPMITSQKPGHRAQVISSPLMLPICANKLGHAILSNSISR